MSFQSYPIKKPLLLSVPRIYKRFGAQLFENLLTYTGVVQGGDKASALRSILALLKEGPPELADEFYFQLIKQTINNMNRAWLLATWDMFMRIASIFPCTTERFRWIMAHIVRVSNQPDAKVAHIAAFVFVRLHGRYCLGTVYDFLADARFLTDTPSAIIATKHSFGVMIYEILWCQKDTYPMLPIPYVLYYLVKLLVDRGALHTEGIFRNQGSPGLVREIRAEVNADITALERADVNCLANLLVMWVEELANPIIPLELTSEFIAKGEKGQFRAFIELLPDAHKRTLTFLIGFLQEVCTYTQLTGIEKLDMAMIFGTKIVNPVRAGKGDNAIVQTLTELSVRFFSQLIQERNASQLYPLNPAYLEPPPAEGVKDGNAQVAQLGEPQE
jgi:hypothetical protein